MVSSYREEQADAVMRITDRGGLSHIEQRKRPDSTIGESASIAGVLPDKASPDTEGEIGVANGDYHHLSQVEIAGDKRVYQQNRREKLSARGSRV